MNKDIAIKVENLSKTFKIQKERKQTIKSYFVNPFHRTETKKFHALKDVSFEVKRGEFLGIIGRNGSGKSTLLKIIAGIYAPTKGKVKVNGRLVPFLELGVGFNPELSGRENIFLNGTILGMSRGFLKKHFDEIVDFAEVREFLDVPLKHYSSGMQVRLAFSIAIQADADVYLLDEVLAVGDAGFQRKCLGFFREFKDQGKTILFVSHSMDSIREHCDRAVLLSKGKVLSLGDVSSVINDYNKENMSLEEKRLCEENRKREEEEKRKQEQEKLEVQRKERKIREEEEKRSKEIRGGNIYRRGNNKARILRYEIRDHHGKQTLNLESGKKFTIKIWVKFNEEVKNPTFGFMFSKNPGEVLFGIHSLYSRKPLQIASVKDGKTVAVVCDGTMLLTPEVYYLTLICTSQTSYSDYEELDFMSSMIKVNVYSGDKFWSYINSESFVTFKEV